MKKNQIKQEFIKRYIYLCDNAELILAPSVLDANDLKIIYPDYNWSKNYVTIEDLRPNILRYLEILLLDDKPLEENRGFKLFESFKETEVCDAEYLKIQTAKIVAYNKIQAIKGLELKLNEIKILTQVYKYIKNQSFDIINKQRKLRVIDEYLRIARFKNDGKIWTSGYNYTSHDISQLKNFSYVFTRDLKPNREEIDIGVLSNKFIRYISSKFMFLSEKEKQEIYLKYHDDDPCQLHTLEDELYIKRLSFVRK